ncbi:glycoside hydrolase family 52 protein [Tengunoibacter tsumagoiensis]|uniref:Beta-xylosidase n=1 Tax=Tengunoibacter tsumagoiensis TaxID=2014871 RepID=A0A401ZZT4_9CHLR|nr:glycoside hydrolase family 52 protein [Tengunoibacter tsumagoiensis]GCE12302.1 hypothetical protein KTT_21610 [Tengunoibacter tsumagoiensis]
MSNIFFNAQHAPIGAFASFTLGYPGASGGLGLELGKPADQSVFIGLEALDGKSFESFPFFADATNERKRYDVEGSEDDGSLLVPFALDQIQRDFQVATDTWSTKELTFRILSPVRTVPDPEHASDEELKRVLLPAIFAELTIDNTQCSHARRAFFGYRGNDPYSSMRRLDDTTEGRLKGIGQGRQTAIVTRDESVQSALGFSLDAILTARHQEQWTFGLGSTGALVIDVPAGVKQTFHFAICFYRDGRVTAGLDTTYYYTHLFPSIEAVAEYALEHYSELAAACEQDNTLVSASTLSSEQKFQLAHAIHSYYGSTQLLASEGRPLWIVNEGEYRMMNTFDLTVDQLFYEMEMHPWTVRNELDLFVERYAYEDRVHFPGDEMSYPGGISFPHDMGVANTFSRPHYSAYETPGIDGCFSYMTYEQLVNWICCASVYLAQTDDRAWGQQRLAIFEACFQSLLNRDHPDPALRNGLMGLDTTRAAGCSEITTYDSLDTSLGQARNNIYLGSKAWSAYLALETIFNQFGLAELSHEAGQQAERCARTLTAALTPDGYIPAVLEGGNTSRIIPAIEGLVFPLFTNNRAAVDPDGRFSTYLQALKIHLQTILVPGICLFEDGGWKLSSTSNNSWLSKIYLCQFVAREILHLPWDERGQAADAAHVNWLTAPENGYWAWSDQIVAGLAKGSRYYPRGVTSILWRAERQ